MLLPFIFFRNKRRVISSDGFSVLEKTAVIDMSSEGRRALKGPKHEIFEIEFFTQIRPVQIGDLGTGEKNSNFVRLTYDSKVFAAYILLSV
jgi:hypothetical protein